MKESLTESWCGWVEKAGSGRSHKHMITLKFLESQILPELTKAGFATCTRRQLEAALTSGVGELPFLPLQHGGPPALGCSFAHVVNLLWNPILQFMDSCTASRSCEWTKELAANHSAVVAEMAGNVLGADEAVDMDTWVEYMRNTLLRLLQVDVPKQNILHAMSHVVPFHVAPTPANGLHLLRSGLCSKLVGPSLAGQVSRLILAEIAEVPVALLSDAELNIQVRQDLVNSLGGPLCDLSDSEDDKRPAKKEQD